AARGPDQLLAALPAALGTPNAVVYQGVFRWSTTPADLPDAGVWVPADDPDGRELSVGTEPAARGQGLARRLVAQAARQVIADGAVATYLHDPANLASARV